MANYNDGTAGYHRSSQKLRVENALKEITSNPVLKAAALAGLGVAGTGANLDSTFYVVDESDATKRINFSSGGATTGKTATIAAANSLDATYTLPAATDTLVGRASTDTLTNKTLTAPVLGGSVTGTYTLAGTGTLTSPTINTPTIKNLTEVVTATNVITAAETGSVFYLNSATEFVSTLPAPAAGLNFKFIVSAAPSGASYTVICAASGTLIKGHVLTSQDAGGSSDSGTTGELTLTFVDGKAVAGDQAEFNCDGTNWFVTGKCKVFDAITIS